MSYGNYAIYSDLKSGKILSDVAMKIHDRYPHISIMRAKKIAIKIKKGGIDTPINWGKY